MKARKTRAPKVTDKQADASNDDETNVEEVAEAAFDDDLAGAKDDDSTPADNLDFDDGEADEEEGGLIQDNIAPDDELLTNIPSGDDE